VLWWLKPRRRKPLSDAGALHPQPVSFVTPGRLVVPGALSTAISSGLPVHRGPAELFAISAPRDILTPGWGAFRMFDVYLNPKRDLLVVRNGLPIPLPDVSGRWRKKKKVASVSEDIKLAIQRQGYYVRKLTDLKKR
jgi:hypothetical protein